MKRVNKNVYLTVEKSRLLEVCDLLDVAFIVAWKISCSSASGIR